MLKKLKEFGYLKDNKKIDPKILKEYLEFTKNWVEDFEKPDVTEIKISDQEKKALEKLIEVIKDEKDQEKLQNKIFELAQEHELKPAKFFPLIYQILLKQNRGPRLGSYIFERGKTEVTKILKHSLK